MAKLKAEEGSKYWSERGEVFQKFESLPKSEMAKPSDWLLVFYAVKCGFAAAGTTLVNNARFRWRLARADPSGRSGETTDESGV